MSSSSVLSPTRGRTRRFLAGVLAAALTAGATAAAAAPSYADEPAAEQRAAAGTVYEAEDGVLTGVTRQTEHAGYTGTGFVGGFGGTGNAVSVTATVETAGTYDLFVRYANGGPTRTLTLGVGDATRQVTLPGSGAWNSYGVVWASVDLQAGANTLSLTRTAADSGQLNVDHFRVAPRVGTRYEAEDAALSGGASLASDHAGYTGTGFVGGFTTAGAAATFTVTATESGNHPATLRYGNGPNPRFGPKKVTLDVNGAQRTIILPGFTSWKTWSDFALDLPLVAGANQVAIRFLPDDDGNVNLDHLDVGPPAPPVCDSAVEPDDAFDGTALDRCRWTTVLNEEPAGFRVADGALSIDARPGDLSGGVANARNVVLQPAPTGASWMAETAVSLDGTDDYLQGGLVLWGNAANFAKLTVIRTPAEGWKVELGKVTANDLQFTGSATLPAGAQTDVRLRMWLADGVVLGAYSLDDGARWVGVGTGYPVGGITDPLVGVSAFNGAGTETARFESFAVGEPALVLSRTEVLTDRAGIRVGETSSVSVSVLAEGATATGEVTLRDGDTVVGTKTLTDGAASFDVGPYTSAGVRQLTATYSGSGTVAGSTGAGSLDVGPALLASTTEVVTDRAGIRVGETSSVYVSVLAEGATATGEVTLRDGETVVGTKALTNGAASFDVGPYTSAGVRQFTATYTGDDTVAGSTGGGSLVVDPALIASTTEVVTDRAGIEVGQTSSVRVSVLTDGETATGEVTLREGETVVGTADLVNGAAEFPVGPYATAGVRQFTATYAGSGTVAGSTGGASLDVRAKPQPQPTPVVKVVGGKADAAANRKSATVRLSCTPAGVTCRGTLTLRAGGKVLGTGTFKVAGGKTVGVKVTLNARARRLLAAKPRTAAQLAVVMGGKSKQVGVTLTR